MVPVSFHGSVKNITSPKQIVCSRNISIPVHEKRHKMTTNGVLQKTKLYRNIFQLYQDRIQSI